MRTETHAGLMWIALALDVRPVQPFAVESTIGTNRKTLVVESLRRETYPQGFLPAVSLTEHLKFALKYEVCLSYTS